MSKVTLSPISSLTNQEAAVAALNANFEAIRDIIDLMYSRDGTSPNTLTANLDMNGYRILNLGEPAADTDVPRLTDLVEGVVGEQGPAGPPGSVADGDKGDIVVSGSGSVWTIDSGLLTNYGRTLTAVNDASGGRTVLALGDAATKNVGTTSNTVAAGDDSRFTRYTVVDKNASYTFDVNDGGTLFHHTSSSAHTFTLNPQASTSYPVGMQFIIKNGPSGGVITLTPGSGVSLYKNGSTSSSTASLAAGSVATVINLLANNWIVVGPGIT